MTDIHRGCAANCHEPGDLSKQNRRAAGAPFAALSAPPPDVLGTEPAQPLGPSFVTAVSSGTAGPLKGRIRVPGDKSISHRALILGALAVGRTRVDGLLEGEDVLRTAAAMRALGARVERTDAGQWLVDGVGVGGFGEPADVLDFGNSGTGARLVLGAVATSPLTAVFTGDASLRKRPMGRVATPLQRMGARITARAGDRLPLTVTGSADPLPLD